MALDEAGQRLFVLDRRDPGNPGGTPAKPRLSVIALNPVPATTPHSVLLKGLLEPTCLVIESTGPPVALLVADARDMDTVQADPTGPFPDAVKNKLVADLLRAKFDPTQPTADLTAVSLVVAPAAPALPVPPKQNPLIYPVGLAVNRKDGSRVLLCDHGLKMGPVADVGTNVDDPSNRVMAEPARLFTVDLSKTPVTITPLTEGPTFTAPSRLALDPDGSLVVTDYGREFVDMTTADTFRGIPHTFGVAVHFSAERSTIQADRSRVLTAIAAVIDHERPAETTWTLGF